MSLTTPPHTPKPPTPKTRNASHAGTWYPATPTALKQQFAQLPQTHTKRKGIKAVIAPHAGYAYSLETAWTAYGCVDASELYE